MSFNTEHNKNNYQKQNHHGHQNNQNKRVVTVNDLSKKNVNKLHKLLTEIEAQERKRDDINARLREVRKDLNEHRTFLESEMFQKGFSGDQMDEHLRALMGYK